MEWGYNCTTLGKKLTSADLSVLIGKMRVCRLNWMIGEVMERALGLESEKPEVQP